VENKKLNYINLGFCCIL